MLKVVIAGGREFNDYEYLVNCCEQVIPDNVSIEVVSGAAPGADTLGEEWAESQQHPVKLFPYESQHGKAGGPIRNAKMADYGHVLIAFWDGKSKGTKNMIDNALKKGLEVHVFPY